MAETKTRPTQVSVEDFIAAVEPASKREDAPVLDALFRRVTGEVPRMWGPSIVGYGEYNTVYDSGRKVSCLRVGFSPRKAKHSLYIACSCDGEKARLSRRCWPGWANTRSATGGAFTSTNSPTSTLRCSKR